MTLNSSDENYHEDYCFFTAVELTLKAVSTPLLSAMFSPSVEFPFTLKNQK